MRSCAVKQTVNLKGKGKGLRQVSSASRALFLLSASYLIFSIDSAASLAEVVRILIHVCTNLFKQTLKRSSSKTCCGTVCSVHGMAGSWYGSKAADVVVIVRLRTFVTESDQLATYKRSLIY